MESGNMQPEGQGSVPNDGGAQMNMGAGATSAGDQAQQQQYQQQMQPGGTKSSIVAGLLGIFLGGLGIHDFYLGYTKFGIIHLAMSFGGGLLSVLLIFLGASSAMTMTEGGVGVGFASWLLAPLGAIIASASGLWGFIAGIMCLAKSGMYAHDASGNPLS